MTRKIAIKRATLTAGVAAVLALGLAACGGHNSTTTAAVVTPPPPKALEDTFGTNFGIAYRANANTEPSHPNPGDINAIDPTLEPTPLHS